MPANFVPKGHTTVIPYLVVENAARCMAFIRDGFGAKEIERHTTPEGQVQHGEMKVFDCVVMIGQASGEAKATQTMLYVYVEDVDLAYKRLLEAGGTSVREPREEDYGHRSAGVRDPDGNQWWLAHPTARG